MLIFASAESFVCVLLTTANTEEIPINVGRVEKTDKSKWKS